MHDSSTDVAGDEKCAHGYFDRTMCADCTTATAERRIVEWLREYSASATDVDVSTALSCAADNIQLGFHRGEHRHG